MQLKPLILDEGRINAPTGKPAAAIYRYVLDRLVLAPAGCPDCGRSGSDLIAARLRGLRAA